MKIEEVGQLLKPIVIAVRKHHSKTRSSLSSSDFRSIVARNLNQIHNADLTVALRRSFLEGPNSEERRLQSTQQRMFISVVLSRWIYAGRMYCPCGNDLSTGFRFTRFLKHPDSYHKSCGNSCRTRRRSKTNLEKYGVVNPMQNKEVQARMATTLFEKYGVTNASQLDFVKSKKRLTSLQRLGVENPSQSEKVQLKKRQASMEKWGTTSPNSAEAVKAAVRETCLSRYGVESTGGLPERIEKMKATIASHSPKRKAEINRRRQKSCQDRYGVRHVMHSEDIARRSLKNGFQQKEIRIKGKLFRGLQGYEPAALNFLVETLGVRVTRLSVGDIGSFNYSFKGKVRKYYPDVRLGSTFIEVKSTFTAGIQGQRKTESYRMLQAKMSAVEREGYQCVCMIRQGHSWVILKDSRVPPSRVRQALRDIRASTSVRSLQLSSPPL